MKEKSSTDNLDGANIGHGDSRNRAIREICDTALHVDKTHIGQNPAVDKDVHPLTRKKSAQNADYA
ncbi:hypothetical protein GCM10027018_04490 [Paenibacillus thermoaerophilus]